jgi:hypothetical protein
MMIHVHLSAESCFFIYLSTLDGKPSRCICSLISERFLPNPASAVLNEPVLLIARSPILTTASYINYYKSGLLILSNAMNSMHSSANHSSVSSSVAGITNDVKELAE